MRRAKQNTAQTLVALRNAGVTLTGTELKILLDLGSPTNRCRVCGKPVHMMIYRGSRYCCQLCELAGR